MTLKTQPWVVVTVDGVLHVHLKDQEAICEKLRAVGVDPMALVHELREDQDVAELLSELRAARTDAQWRAIEPYHERLWKIFDALTKALAKRSMSLPDGTHAHSPHSSRL